MAALTFKGLLPPATGAICAVPRAMRMWSRARNGSAWITCRYFEILVTRYRLVNQRQVPRPDTLHRTALLWSNRAEGWGRTLST